MRTLTACSQYGMLIFCLGQKLFKFDKNVIAHNEFDDYYKKFSCND